MHIIQQSKTDNNYNITSENITYLLKKYAISLLVIMIILYLIPIYQIVMYSVLLILFISIFSPNYINNFYIKISEYIYDIFTDYLGNCTFDPLPKSKN